MLTNNFSEETVRTANSKRVGIRLYEEADFGIGLRLEAAGAVCSIKSKIVGAEYGVIVKK